MNEVLEKMLSSELLTEDTRNELLEAFKTEIEKVKADARETAITEAKEEYTLKFAEDKVELVEALDTKITALYQEELAELRESIDRFRDLEAEYATKLVEEKEKMSLQLQADMKQLAESLDVFVKQELDSEIKELKESIEEVRKIEFARKLFESIEGTFKEQFFNESELAQKLKDQEVALEEKAKKLKESETTLNKLVREKEFNKVLSSLHGRPREIMEAILKSVPTDKLNEAYETYIGRVLHESTVTEDKSEKEDKTSVLAENTSTKVTKVNEEVVKTGDTVEPVIQERQSTLSESERDALRRHAGLLG